MSTPSDAELLAVELREPISVGRSLSSLIVLAFLSGAYLWGLVALCNQSLLFEAALSVGLPLFCWLSGRFAFPVQRLMELLAFESLFNVLVVVSKLGLLQGVDALAEVGGWGFALFFALQLGGFVAFQIERRSLHGVLQSALAALFILRWWLSLPDHAGRLDADGRFLMWGQDAPLAIQIYYAIWVLNVLLVESPTLPRLREATVQIVSVCLALASGEFFHVRLLTACHLFVLDLVTGYTMSNPHALGPGFGVLPTAWHEACMTTGRRAIAWASTLGCAGVFIASLLWGLDLGG